MVDKCANPACSERFRRLSQGRVFVIEVQADDQTSQSARQLQYFWLCNSCCHTMTVMLDRANGVLVVPLPESGTAAAS